MLVVIRRTITYLHTLQYICSVGQLNYYRRELATHSHTAATNSAGAHTHSVGIGWNDDGGDTGYFDTTNVHRADYNTTSAGNHTHNVTISNNGSNTPHNNIQPYITTYIWRRTA